jgi:hypothetical protein
MQSPVIALCSSDLWVKISPVGEGDRERATRDFHRNPRPWRPRTEDELGAVLDAIRGDVPNAGRGP